MNKVKLIMLCFICYLLSITLLNQSYVSATTNSIQDNADIFSETEETQLNSQIDSVIKEQNTNIVILTEKSIGKSNRKQYIENYYDTNQNEFKASYKGTVIMLINMDAKNRGVEIQGYGDAEQTISDDRSQDILDNIIPSLKDKKYYNGANLFIELVQNYNTQEPTTNYTHTQKDNEAYDSANKPNILTFTWFQLILALVIGAVIVLLLCINLGTKVTTTASTYLNQDSSRVLARQDIYVRTTISRVPKPKNPPPGSGSGGGVSSGGNSHSGGGSSF